MNFLKKTKGKNNMRKLGFTLAEVLITLVIIGVIAAMTVPSLMQNTNSQEFRSALKKAISGANQALTLEYALEGLSAGDFSNSQDIVNNVFRKRMAVIETSDANTWGSVTRTGATCSDNATFTTNDGIKFCVTGFSADIAADTQSSKCNTYNTLPCGDKSSPQLWIDVNGDRKPNRSTTSSQRPRDIYQAQIYAQKIVPYGAPTQEVMFDKEVTPAAAPGA